MRAALIAVGVVLGILAMVGGVLAVSYVSAYNTGNRLEQGIVAAYDHNKNVLSQYTLKVAEAAQVPAMMRDDLTKVVQVALSSRYGADGSKAMFQFIKEQNPTLSPDIYIKIQQIIEGGRNDFKQAQDELIDKKRVYETQLGYFWRGMWLKIAGYPKINLADYKIVVEDTTEQTFKDGHQSAIKIR